MWYSIKKALDLGWQDSRRKFEFCSADIRGFNVEYLLRVQSIIRNRELDSRYAKAQHRVLVDDTETYFISPLDPITLASNPSSLRLYRSSGMVAHSDPDTLYSDLRSQSLCSLLRSEWDEEDGSANTDI